MTSTITRENTALENTAFENKAPVKTQPREQGVPRRSPERDELLASVERLAPFLRENALKAEEGRTLPRPVVEAMKDAGLFRIAAPQVVGGYEVDPLTHLEVIEAVARIDSSAAWTLMIGAQGAAMIATFASDAVVDRMFGGPTWPIAGSQMNPAAGRFRRVDGGYVVSGRWSFASGIRHADWSMFTATASEPSDDSPKVIAGVLPVSEVTVHDNWFVSGLKGTGSSDYSLDEQFVPDDMAWPMPPAILRGGPRYRIKIPQATLSAFALGIARRSIDEIALQSRAKLRPGSTTAVAARPYFHHQLGEFEMRLAAARAGLFQLVEQLWEAARSGGAIPPDLDMRLTATPAYVHSVAADITSAAFRFGGSGAARLDNVLQRNFRDMAVAAQHIQASEQAYEALGRYVLDAAVDPA
ncbi:acyl-CoA dehydrogenase family protein [uncultured Amnibacterium sp.]|uniref:acyl-CoA dehydrogenase family protein n=1 Tax=uncultured Amnibacterium sp. TaxID=1631851 RepID=UPI0035CB5224